VELEFSEVPHSPGPVPEVLVEELFGLGDPQRR